MATPTKIQQNIENRRSEKADTPEILAAVGAHDMEAEIETEFAGFTIDEKLTLLLMGQKAAKELYVNPDDALFESTTNPDKQVRHSKGFQETVGANRNRVSRACDAYERTKFGGFWRTVRRVADVVAPPVLTVGLAYMGVSKWWPKEVTDEMSRAV